MSDIAELYQELILDHNKRPRNRGGLDDANHEAEGYNPLCGDRVTIRLILKDDRIEEIRFDGAGCAISTASASLMSEAVKGKTLAEARALFERFHDLVAGEHAGDGSHENGGAPSLGKLDAFAGVGRYPARVKCATLAWHTLNAALEDRGEIVTTEQRAMTETNANEPTKDALIKVLRSIHDPEIPINIYDLGLIYDLEVADAGVVTVRMTLTAPNCPMADVIVQQVESKLRAADGVSKVVVDLVWDPKWDPDMMSEAARLELEFTGHTGPAHLRKDKFSSLTVGRTSKHPSRRSPRP